MENELEEKEQINPKTFESLKQKTSTSAKSFWLQGI